MTISKQVQLGLCRVEQKEQVTDWNSNQIIEAASEDLLETLQGAIETSHLSLSD